MTSTLGFEALIRGRSVTCLGQPFYSGWGLTTDLDQTQIRRRARPSLAMLVHACVIDYPRYVDPVTAKSCPVEVAIERLETGDGPKKSTVIRALAGLQSFFRAFKPLWRR